VLARLTSHPTIPAGAVIGVEVEVVRADPTTLTLTYVIAGDIAALAVPQPAAPMRTDELWRRTCLEAFVRPEGGEAYLEFNLSPSSQWAAYAFAGYREGMAEADLPPPRISVEATPTTLRLQATLQGLPPGACRLALTAVIEETGGHKSYWALAHPRPDRPDFHHAAGFALGLPHP
jgi:hypothetical protein